MVASSWSLQVNQATSGGAPLVWGNDAYWFVKSFEDPRRKPTYNFIIMERMDAQAITRRFGSPDQVHTCPGDRQVWVYDDGEELTSRFLAPLAGPPGSYQTSCSDAMLIGSELSGRCRTTDGSWLWTRLNTSRCAGPIGNVGGRLTCDRR
jgi:hypothetical protein